MSDIFVYFAYKVGAIQPPVLHYSLKNYYPQITKIHKKVFSWINILENHESYTCSVDEGMFIAFKDEQSNFAFKIPLEFSGHYDFLCSLCRINNRN